MTPTFTDRTPKQFKFSGEKSRPIVVNFQGGTVTSDAGLSLIAEINRKLEITSKFAQCFQDYRKPYRINHSIESLTLLCHFRRKKNRIRGEPKREKLEKLAYKQWIEVEKNPKTVEE
jgi:hypothetical protein